MIADNSATIAQHDQRLNDLDAGVAMALALASVPVVPSKDFSLGLAVGSYNGQEGYAAKLNWVAATNLVVSGGVGANSRNEVSGAIGVSIGW